MSHSVPADAPQDVAVTHRTAGAATETVPVTVVVPVRDGADFAEECLDSVLASRPDEVIVVDGGSSDGTLDAARRRGLRVVTHEGSGPASARMAGAALAAPRRRGAPRRRRGAPRRRPGPVVRGVPRP